MGKYDDDNLTEEMMLDIWDGLKEEPCSRKDGYPAKKQKSKKKIKAEWKKTKRLYRIHYRFDGLDLSEVQEAYSGSQAVTVFCKLSNSWYVKKEVKNKTRGFWVEEIKEGKSKVGPLTNEQWNKLYAIKDDCYGSHDYGSSKSSSMTTIISCGKARLCFQQFRTGNFLAIISKDYDIHGNYKLSDDAVALLFDNIFKYVGGIWSKRLMPEQFCNYVAMAKICLIVAGIIEDEIVKEMKEEQEMKEDKEMNLDQLVEEANKAAEAEVVNAIETQQEENNNEKEEVVMSKENEKIQEQVIEEQTQEEQPIVIENAIPVATITLETIANNMKQLSVALMPQDEKKGILQAIRVTDGEFEDIGSYVIGGGYAFPLFRISSKWFKKTTLSVNRKVDTTNRTIGFSGSKNYMALLRLLFTDEEIEAAKAQEISRRFPPICQRSESKGVEKNIAVTVAINGETITLTGWVQREWRPLYLENADRTVTVRWDFGKGYKSPSIKYNSKMLRENHDGVSGDVNDAKVFEAIKAAILAELDKA